MTPPELPHMGFPYRRGAWVEQDSDQHVTACEARIALCPLGARRERPEFGWPWPMFQNVPLDTAPLTQALERFEPRGHADATDYAELISAAMRRISVDVEVEGGGDGGG